MLLIKIEKYQREFWQSFGHLSRDESIITKSITYTFFIYLLGALYLLAPVIGWGLAIAVIIRWVGGQEVGHQNTRWLIILWCLSACLLEISLIAAHIDFDLGLGKLIKSTIGWAKGWALLSIFLVLGYTLKLRYQLICRSACIVGLIAIISTPILIFAYILGLPETLYVSPLKVFGGAGPEFFTVRLYEIDPFNGKPRWRFFAPWAPAVGLVANIYFMCAWFERDRKWKLLGLIGNALMIFMATSRMGIIVLLFAPVAVWMLSRLSRSWVMITTAIMLILVALFFEPLFDFANSTINDIKGARADSTRVRASLANIAYYRWETQAFWFGHGVVETGTHLVEFMPIGSHHNWYGLLFVKGLLGFLSFLVPFVLTILVLLIKAQYPRRNR